MQQLKQKYSSYDSYVYLRVTFWESTGRAEMGERKAVVLYRHDFFEKSSTSFTCVLNAFTIVHKIIL